jgi:hypothetical protein
LVALLVCKCGERSEPRDYVCRAAGFVNAASDASLRSKLSEASLSGVFVVLLVVGGAPSTKNSKHTCGSVGVVNFGL